MMKQMQAMGQTGRNGQPQQSDRDPLGRPSRSTGADFGPDKNMLPGAADVQRARQILDEIRKRLGNALSPQEEKDYLERLLKFD